MDISKQQIEDFANLLDVSVSLKTIEAVVAFCIKHEKIETVKKIKAVLAEFEKSLTDKERKELREDIDTLISIEAEKFHNQLKEELPEEQVKEILTKLKDASTTIFDSNKT